VFKAAAIDVGSSATRLSLLTVRPTGTVVHNELQRFDMRLGADVFADGTISAARQAALVDLFGEIAHILRRAGVRRYRAVATSAMRDANNGAAMVAAIRARSGLRLEIITGETEGALARRALVRALGSVDPNALLVDLGGGSLEIERLGQGQGRSVPMGTVRLLALFPALGAPLTPEKLHAAQGAIAARLQAVVGEVEAAPQAIGTGGNLEALARVLGASNGLVAQFAAAELAALAEAVAPMPLAARVARFQIRPDRADLFLPAVLVLQALARHYDLARFVVPRTGLREALLVDLMPGGGRPPPAKNCAPLTQLSLALFDLLFPLHGLWPPARRTLAAIAQARALQVAGESPPARLPTGRRAYAVEEQAVYAASLARIGNQRLPTQVASQAHVAAVLAAVVRLAEAAGTDLAGPAVRALCGALHLDIIGMPARLHVGVPLQPDAIQPLVQALGREVVLR
jgi:exopolyphosphatase/guanosine-5'-triphosphate,3'-diphosphate pyrophosphatase